MPILAVSTTQKFYGSGTAHRLGRESIERAPNHRSSFAHDFTLFSLLGGKGRSKRLSANEFFLNEMMVGISACLVRCDGEVLVVVGLYVDTRRQEVELSRDVKQE